MADVAGRDRRIEAAEAEHDRGVSFTLREEVGAAPRTEPSELAGRRLEGAQEFLARRPSEVIAWDGREARKGAGVSLAAGLAMTMDDRADLAGDLVSHGATRAPPHQHVRLPNDATPMGLATLADQTISMAGRGRDMLILLSFVVIAVAFRFPETPGGKLVKHLLIDAPARLAARITFGRIIVLLFVALIVAGLFALAKTDGLMMAGQAAPEGLAWLATFDVATWADTVALVMLIGAAGKLRGSWRIATHSIRRLVERAFARVAGLFRGLRAAMNTRSRRRPRSGSRPPKPDGDIWQVWGAIWLPAQELAA